MKFKEIKIEAFYVLSLLFIGSVGLYLLALLVQTIKQFVQNDYHSWSDSFLIHLNLMVKLVKQQLLM